MRIAIFPGSFDPFTKGHEDVVKRGAQLFDKVIIALGNNGTKQRYFQIEDMKCKIETVFKDDSRISVEIYQGLTSHFAKEHQAHFLLRGLRNTTDFEYENTIAQANKYLFPEMETVFLITSPSLAYISSTIVRELHKFGSPVDAFLPYSLD